MGKDSFSEYDRYIQERGLKPGGWKDPEVYVNTAGMGRFSEKTGWTGSRTSIEMGDFYNESIERQIELSQNNRSQYIPEYLQRTVQFNSMGMPSPLANSKIIPTYEYVRSGHVMHPFAERSIRSYKSLLKSNSQSAFHTSIDIENIGIKRNGGNLFAITELGLSGMRMRNKNGSLRFSQNPNAGLSLVGNIEGIHGELQTLINKVKNSGVIAALSPDEHLSLWWLTKYANESSFEQKVFNGMNVWTYKGLPPGVDPLSKTANLRMHVKEMEAGLNNLQTHGNSLQNLMSAMNHYVDKTAKSGGRLFGYNILEYDIPALIKYFNETGASATDSKVRDLATSIVGGLNKLGHENKVIDVYSIATTAFNDPINQLTNVVMDKAEREAEIIRARRGDAAAQAHIAQAKLRINRWKRLGGGHMRQEEIAPLLGRSTDFHMALADARVTPKVLQDLLPSLTDKYFKPGMGKLNNRTLRHLEFSDNVVSSGKLKRGSRLFSRSGIGSNMSGPFDGVYMYKDDAFIDPYSRFADKYLDTSKGLGKNTVYNLFNFSKVQMPGPNGGTMNGYGLTLHNESEDLYHFFFRETEDEIKHLIHQNLVPYTSDIKNELQVANGIKIDERTRRNYDKLFASGKQNSYERASKFMNYVNNRVGEHADIWNAQTIDELFTTGKFGSPQEARDFLNMRERLASESKLINAALSQLGNVTADSAAQANRIRHFAMVTIGDMLTGKIVREGTVPIDAKRIVDSRFGKPWAFELAGNIFNVGTQQQSRSSVRSLTRKLGLFGTLEQVDKFLTPAERRELELLAKAQTGKSGHTFKETLANILYDRTQTAGFIKRFANGSVSSVVKDAVEHGPVTNMLNVIQQGVKLKNSKTFGIWDNASDDQINKLVDFALEQGRSKSRGWLMNTSGEGKTFSLDVAPGSHLESIMKEHDSAIGRQIGALGPDPKIAQLLQKGASGTLKDLAAAYSAGGVADVQFMAGPNRNSIVMAVFAKKHAESITKQTSSEILRDKRVVSFTVPFVNKDFLMTSGHQMRINGMYLSKGGQFETGFDMLTNAIRWRAGEVINYIQSGTSDDYIQARKSVRGSINKVMNTLSGVGVFEDDDVLNTNKIKQLSKPSIMQRAFILQVTDQEILEDVYHFGQRQLNPNVPLDRLSKVKYGDMGSDELRIVKRYMNQYLDEVKGIKTNAHTLKENQFLKGMVASLYDVRLDTPFGTYSAAATMRMTQALNAFPVLEDAVTDKKLLNPLIMTEHGLNTFGISSGETPHWLTHGVGYMDDSQVDEILKKSGVDVPFKPSTFDSRAFMKKSAAEMHKIATVTEFEVGKPSNEIFEAFFKNNGELPSAAFNKKLTIGEIMKERIYGPNGELLSHVDAGEEMWDKKGKAKVIGLEFSQEGKWIVKIRREMDAATGMKLVTSGGEKFTVSLVDDTDWEKMFPGLNMNLVMSSNAVKHRAYGDIMKSQLSMFVSELNKVTVGDKAKDEITSKLNSFFETDGFRFGSFGSYGNGLIVPDQLNRQRVPLTGDGSLKKLIANLSTTAGITTKLSAKVHEVEFSMGIENVGRQFIEDWFKSSGFGKSSGGGLVKYGQRELQMMRLSGMSETASYYKGVIDQRGQEYHKEIWKHWKALKGLVGAPLGNEVLVKTNGAAIYGANEMAFSSFNKFPLLDADQVSTRDKYIGTWYDVKNSWIKDGAARPGDLTKSISSKIGNSGAIFELPFQVDVQVGTDKKGAAVTKTIDRIFLPHTDLIKGPGDTVYQSELGTATSRVIRNIGETIDSMKDPNAVTEDIKKRLTGSVQNLANVVNKNLNQSGGTFADHVMAAKMEGSGQFQIATFSPTEQFDISKDGKPSPAADKAEGHLYITQARFNEMTEGLGSHRQGALNKLAQTEGLYVLGNRYPTLSTRSVNVFKLMVNDQLAGDDKLARLTVGDAIAMGADNDGDFMSIVMSHYGKLNGGDIANGRSTKVIDEMKAIFKEQAGYRQDVGNLVLAAYKKEYGNQDFNFKKYGELTEKLQNSLLNEPVSRVSASMGREALEARVGREAIGFFSNVAYSMRNVAEAVHNVSADFGKMHVDRIANLGELVEQAAISSKHFSIEALQNEVTKQAEKGITTSVDELFAQRINTVQDLRQSLVDHNITKFKEAANTLGAMDVNAQRHSQQSHILLDADGNTLTGKLGARQKYTVEEMFESLSLLNTKTNEDLGKSIWHPSVRFGVSGGVKSLTDIYDLMEGRMSGSYPTENVKKFREIIDEAKEKARAVELNQNDMNALASRTTGFNATGSQYADNFGNVALRATDAMESYTVGEMSMDRMFGSAKQAVAGSKLASMGWGAAAFAGLMVASNAMTDPLPKDMMPRSDEAPMGDGTYVATPSGAPGGPVARVMENGGGYENLQVSIRARDAQGLSEDQIGRMVQEQISAAMPVQFNMNINTTDNTQRIDNLWVQSVVQNALTKGQAF